MDNADPAKKSRSKAIQSELSTCRDRVRLLVEDKVGKSICQIFFFSDCDLQDSPYTSFLEHTIKFLNDASLSGVDDEVVRQLSEEQDGIRLEIDALRIRIDQLKNELEILWQDCNEAAYELTSVFIHRGSSPSWGHYFFYSRHLPGSPDSWFKYNDSDVTVVSKDEVLADTTGSTANPYLVCFISRPRFNKDPYFLLTSLFSLVEGRMWLTRSSVSIAPC